MSVALELITVRVVSHVITLKGGINVPVAMIQHMSAQVCSIYIY